MRTPLATSMELLRATERLNAYRSVLVELVAVARVTPALSDKQLRDRLVGLAAQAARELGGEPQ